jgi:hypothetical protein
LYHFDPPKPGVLYLLMLAGSLLAECCLEQVGDTFVSSNFSCPLGMLGIIDKRNTKSAAATRGLAPKVPLQLSINQRMVFRRMAPGSQRHA